MEKKVVGLWLRRWKIKRSDFLLTHLNLSSTLKVAYKWGNLCGGAGLMFSSCFY